MRKLGFLGVLVLAAGSAVAEAREDPAKPDPRIGEEVNRICFARNIDSWKEIDGEDRAILLQTGVRNWHRVELSAGCRSRDFRFAHWIGIDSRPAGGCVTPGDAIIVDTNGPFTRRCIITKINKWDETAQAPEAEAEEGE